METITKPQCKLQQVIHLLKIAKELNILNDKMFDILMDKSEQNPLIFSFMIENINDCILNKAAVFTTASNFKKLLTIHTYGEIYTSNVFIPHKDEFNQML